LTSLVKQTVDAEKQQIPAKLELIKLQDTFLRKKKKEAELQREINELEAKQKEHTENLKKKGLNLTTAPKNDKDYKKYKSLASQKTPLNKELNAVSSDLDSLKGIITAMLGNIRRRNR
jgi:seryl-tRNA synthetase